MKIIILFLCFLWKDNFTKEHFYFSKNLRINR